MKESSKVFTRLGLQEVTGELKAVLVWWWTWIWSVVGEEYTSWNRVEIIPSS